MSKADVLQRKADKLQKELEKVRAEQERLKALPPEAVLDHLYEDKNLRGHIATAVYKMADGDRCRAARILGTSVSDLHNAMNSVKGAE